MHWTPVKVVRIYVTDGPRAKDLLGYLKAETAVRGATVYRAIGGFSRREAEGAGIVDLALHLPLIIEFMDSPERVIPILEHLESQVPPGHLYTWDATVNGDV